MWAERVRGIHGTSSKSGGEGDSSLEVDLPEITHKRGGKETYDEVQAIQYTENA